MELFVVELKPAASVCVIETELEVGASLNSYESCIECLEPFPPVRRVEEADIPPRIYAHPRFTGGLCVLRHQ